MAAVERNAIEYFVDCWKKALDFSGRSRRAEYWWFALINAIAQLALLVLASMAKPLNAVYGLYALVSILPSLSAGIRRLHDIGKSGWYLFLSLIPIVGGIILLVWAFKDGDRGPNKYGPSPKY